MRTSGASVAHRGRALDRADESSRRRRRPDCGGGRRVGRGRDGADARERKRGLAAAKTAAYGGRVIGSRSRLSLEQLEVLWRPIQPAIPLSSLVAVTKSRR